MSIIGRLQRRLGSGDDRPTYVCTDCGKAFDGERSLCSDCGGEELVPSRY